MEGITDIQRVEIKDAAHIPRWHDRTVPYRIIWLQILRVLKLRNFFLGNWKMSYHKQPERLPGEWFGKGKSGVIINTH